MTWLDFIQTVRVRALEESDGQDRVWDAETRRTATQDTEAKAGRQPASFLPKRARSLLAKVKEATLPERLSLPTVPGWFSLVWVAAFLAGWWLAALGQEQEINLLALPLIGILAWNIAVMAWSLITSFGKPHEPVWLSRMLDRWVATPDPDASSDALLSAARVKFRHLSWSPSLQRLACQLHAWLHIGAAMLALGSLFGMYVHGWSKEYRAVWESTLLDEKSAETFLGALFTPASKVTGITIPLDRLPAMHRHAGRPADTPGEALPWIHLYAATLGLLVITPRLLLALWDISRARAVAKRTLNGSEWRGYVQRLLSHVDGSGTPAWVLTHGLHADATTQDLWRHSAHKLWPDVGRLSFASVPVGEETEFVSSWTTGAHRVLLIFNMASTPEAEVHRGLAQSLLEKNGGAEGVLALVLALDDREIRKRWSGFGDSEKRLSDRHASWKQMMIGLDVKWADASASSI